MMAVGARVSRLDSFPFFYLCQSCCFYPKTTKLPVLVVTRIHCLLCIPLIPQPTRQRYSYCKLKTTIAHKIVSLFVEHRNDFFLLFVVLLCFVFLLLKRYPSNPSCTLADEALKFSIGWVRMIDPPSKFVSQKRTMQKRAWKSLQSTESTLKFR